MSHSEPHFRGDCRVWEASWPQLRSCAPMTQSHPSTHHVASKHTSAREQSPAQQVQPGTSLAASGTLIITTSTRLKRRATTTRRQEPFSQLLGTVQQIARRVAGCPRPTSSFAGYDVVGMCCLVLAVDILQHVSTPGFEVHWFWELASDPRKAATNDAHNGPQTHGQYKSQEATVEVGVELLLVPLLQMAWQYQHALSQPMKGTTHSGAGTAGLLPPCRTTACASLDRDSKVSFCT